MLVVAAFVCFVFAVPPVPVCINLTALGLALLTLALFLRPQLVCHQRWLGSRTEQP
jgi:hypothetical protein